MAAMTSNLMFACRANFSKALMTQPPTNDGASLSAANLYGLVTIVAFAVFSPVAILTGYKGWRPAWDAATQDGGGKMLAFSVLCSGISHYLNNEVGVGIDVRAERFQSCARTCTSRSFDLRLQSSTKTAQTP